MEHRDPETLRCQLQFLGEKGPGKMNSFTLEVISKTEVTQHFEKGVVPGGIAHIFQVIMLTARSHTALRGGGPTIGTLVLPQENILELHHTGIGEEKRRIISGHE